MSADEILIDTEERMEKAISVLGDNLSGIRTGRATPAWLIRSRLRFTDRCSRSNNSPRSARPSLSRS